MLPAEPAVLLAREGFVDAQAAMAGPISRLGYFNVGWYGTDINDDRGSFALVNATGPLSGAVGDFLNVRVAGRSVNVYCVGASTQITADLALTRRAYLAISLLAVDPVYARVART